MPFFNAFCPKGGANAQALAAPTVLDDASRDLDAEALAIAVFDLANQLHARHPDLAAKYGWARLDDVQTFTKAVLGATQATPPDGLH